MDLTNPAELLEQIPEFAEELMEPEDCFPEGKGLHILLLCCGKKPSLLLVSISPPLHCIVLAACCGISLDALNFLLQMHTQKSLVIIISL